MSRAISLAYGSASGAAVVQLGFPPLVVVSLGLMVGVVLELYRDHKQRMEEVDSDG